MSTLSPRDRVIVRHAIEQTEAQHLVRELLNRSSLLEHALANAEEDLRQARREIRRLDRQIALGDQRLARLHDRWDGRDREMSAVLRKKVRHLEAALRAACLRNKLLVARNNVEPAAPRQKSATGSNQERSLTHVSAVRAPARLPDRQPLARRNSHPRT